MNWKPKDKYEIEDHPFETFIPANASRLIIGTFPTYKDNYKDTFKFYYSGKENLFWQVVSRVFPPAFQYQTGDEAVIERQKFLTEHRIGITDMHLKCYRKNKWSTDENLFPIILKDIFALLDEHNSVERLILTSRTEVFGVLGLLKTYFLQNHLELPELERREDKILHGSFKRNDKEIEIIVPYSSSPRPIEKGRTTMDELVRMYSHCLTNK